MNKKTIASTVQLEGVGIHTGQIIKIALKPSNSGHIEFVLCTKNKGRIVLDPYKTVADNSMVLADGETKVRTIEHLLAVLHVFGLDSLVVEMSGEEIPAMDGSALPFVQAVQKAGLVELPQKKERIKITKSFRIQEDTGTIDVSPGPDFRISYRIEYDHPLIGEQEITWIFNQDSFIQDIAPARTFGFLDNVAELWARDLALGGSLENAIVLDDRGVINGPLRFQDEFVRHKVLDFLGDLALLKTSLIGHFKGDRAGHRLHRACVLYLIDHRHHWTLG